MRKNALLTAFILMIAASAKADHIVWPPGQGGQGGLTLEDPERCKRIQDSLDRTYCNLTSYGQQVSEYLAPGRQYNLIYRRGRLNYIPDPTGLQFRHQILAFPAAGPTMANLTTADSGKQVTVIQERISRPIVETYSWLQIVYTTPNGDDGHGWIRSDKLTLFGPPVTDPDDW